MFPVSTYKPSCDIYLHIVCNLTAGDGHSTPESGRVYNRSIYSEAYASTTTSDLIVNATDIIRYLDKKLES